MKKWCMCTKLESVARDMFSTCSICGGQDAYGTSKNRHGFAMKIVEQRNNLRNNSFVTPRIKCPWCQSETISEDHGDNGWFIGCVNNDCDIKPSFWANGEFGALKVWNSAKI